MDAESPQETTDAGQSLGADVVLDALGVDLGDLFWNAQLQQEGEHQLVPFARLTGDILSQLG